MQIRFLCIIDLLCFYFWLESGSAAAFPDWRLLNYFIFPLCNWFGNPREIEGKYLKVDANENG